MKKPSIIFLPVALSLLLASCGSDQGNSQVVSQRYIHKFGYAVAKEDWEKHRYPGQVVTVLRDGVTITATYENGKLHGPCSYTYPHSQTVHRFHLYNAGNMVKEITYDQIGMPTKESVQLSPKRHVVTHWYQDGTPLSIENYAGEELIDGEYLTQTNEVESRVEHGTGQRIRRTPQGVLLGRDQLENGFLTKRETFYASGMPESIATYEKNKLHGEKRVFSETGEPTSIQEWNHGNLHGKSTFFAGGVKQKELFYLNGEKNGLETHYIDGDRILQEILWSHDKRHGPSKFYSEGVAAQFEWYYDGNLVSQRKYDELNGLDKMITKSVVEFNETATR